MSEMPVEDFIRVHLAARCPYLHVRTHEEDRVRERLEAIAKPLFERTWLWSVTEGLRTTGGTTLGEDSCGPMRALEHLAADSKRCLYIFLDFHPYLREAKVVRKLRDLIGPLQSSSSSVVFLSPHLDVPDELEKEITFVEYPLPDADNLRELLSQIEKGVRANPSLSVDLDEEGRDALVRAALGLTENEAKNVLAKALARDRTLDARDVDVILADKAQIVRKSGVLEYFSSLEDFGSLGGLEQLKAWLKVRAQAFGPKARDFGLPAPKGLLLIGIPGCGKSLTAKIVAKEWSQPLLKLDVGKLFGGLVGASEENIRRTIRFAEAIAPCVLWIDEIEKGFSGFKALGDSGTTARVFSTFLTWMQEKTSPVFVMATANDISLLPPEFLRKGRFDEIFFVDLPFPAERKEILNIHLHKRKRDPQTLGIDLDRLVEASEGFSGAELEEAVVSGLFDAFASGRELDTDAIKSAIEATYPLSETMPEPIRNMREWAKERARYASIQWRDEHGKSHAAERWASIAVLPKEDGHEV